jgi:hypothetical protein
MEGKREEDVQADERSKVVIENKLKDKEVVPTLISPNLIE